MIFMKGCLKMYNRLMLLKQIAIYNTAKTNDYKIDIKRDCKNMN